jgi:TolB-like protein
MIGVDDCVGSFLCAVPPALSKEKIIAVLPFYNNTGDENLEWLSSSIPELLIVTFTKVESITVVEVGSTRLAEILDIIGIGMSGLADPESASEVGKLIPAKEVVCGSYSFYRGSDLTIIGRVIDVETGEVLNAVKRSGSQENVEHLVEQIGYMLALDESESLPPLPKSRSKAALKSMMIPGWGDWPDRKICAASMAGLQLITIAIAAIYQSRYTSKLEEYSDARERYSDIGNFSDYPEYKAQRELMLSKHDDAVNSKRLRNVLLFSATVGVRIAGALESAAFASRAGGEELSIMPNTRISVNHSSARGIFGDSGDVVLAWGHRF